jgi:hypothetical protein
MASTSNEATEIVARRADENEHGIPYAIVDAIVARRADSNTLPAGLGSAVDKGLDSLSNKTMASTSNEATEIVARRADENEHGIPYAIVDAIVARRDDSNTLPAGLGSAVKKGQDSVLGINTFAASTLQSVVRGVAAPHKARAFSEEVDPIYAAVETRAGEAKGDKNKPIYSKSDVPLDITTGGSTMSIADKTLVTLERTSGSQPMDADALKKLCRDEVCEKDDEDIENRSFRMDDAQPKPAPMPNEDLFCHQSQRTQNSSDVVEDDDVIGGGTAGVAGDEVSTKSGSKRKNQII